MILSELVQYYEDEAKKGNIPQRGWSAAKVSYELRLNEDGEFIGLQSIRVQEQRGKTIKDVPILLNVPKQATRTSGIAPFFLCDKAEYLLGLNADYSGTSDQIQSDEEEKVKEKNKKKILKKFESSKKLHTEILGDVDSVVAKAICRFLEKWNPAPEIVAENTAIQQEWDGLSSGANIIFSLNGTQRAQDDSAISDAWNHWYQQTLKQGDTITGTCLITGRHSPIARIHPLIKGVKGAQSSGGALISYNTGKQAFESYGKKDAQAYNAYVSEYAAFAYTTALNSLLSDGSHKKQLGDTTIVYWAKDDNKLCQDIFSDFFDSDEAHRMTDSKLNDILNKIQDGMPFDYQGVSIAYDNPFYILGLAPNAARLSVRFFLKGCFGDFLKNFAEHEKRMEIVKPSYIREPKIPLWKILRETANPNSQDKAASPLLAGAVFRSILLGQAYPISLYQNILMRIHADSGEGKISFYRAAIIRAYMLRNKRRRVSVALDEQSTNTAYVLGRLFAELERIQQDANPEINTTIKDRYFNSACSTPAYVFPVLEKLSQHHLRKLSDGSRIYHEKCLGMIIDLLNLSSNPIPKNLTLDEQGIFILGYYHQRQKFFEPKKINKNISGEGA